MKKILVYGRGKIAEKFVNSMSVNVNYEMIGITDSFVTKEEIGEKCYNLIICNREEVKNPNVDVIVVCTFNYSEEIIRQLKADYPKIENVYTVDQFLIKVNEMDEIGMKENELYHYFMYGKHATLTKWLHYFEVYEQYFSKYKNKEVVFCEVGVFRGGSLQMWKNYFGEKATIIGIDINEECMQYAADNIFVEIGSQGDEKFWDYIKKKYPKIDILLDDGGHEMDLQKITFDCMFPHIQDNGVYMCEDTHTSYWSEYGGVYKGDTYIEYAKGLVDDINAFHSRTEQLKINYNTLNIRGLHFYDSMVVIEKKCRKNGPIAMIKESDKDAYVLPI